MTLKFQQNLATSSFYPLSAWFKAIAQQLSQPQGHPVTNLFAASALVLLTTALIIVPLFVLSHFWQLLFHNHDSLLTTLIDWAIWLAHWLIV
ncbi:MAG: hypothetical protein ACWA5U_03525 [bacterium]